MSSRRWISAAAISLSVISAGGDVAAAASPAADEVVVLRRLSETEYRNSVADIFGSEIEVKGSFEAPLRVGGLLAAGAKILSVTPPGYGSYLETAGQIADQVVSEQRRGQLLSCAPKNDKAPDDACTAQILGHYAPLLLRRPLMDAELKQRVKLANAITRSSGSFYTGLRYGLASFMQSPDFLFRREVAVRSEGQNYSLQGFSRASRLSFLLWNSTPDAELLRAAGAGELNTSEGVGKQVDRMMASPKFEAGMTAFFRDMLELDTFDNITKDAVIYPDWTALIPAAAQEETLRTVIGLSLHENGDIRDIVTTRKTYINRALASIYVIPFRFQAEWVPHEFPADSGRSGLLTQISMLGIFSHPGRSSPTKRGVGVMDVLLCEQVPNPPANIDFSDANDPNGPLKTVRERLNAHANNPVCVSCHKMIDPIGLTLENFDSIGVFRQRENGTLIDASVTIRNQTYEGASGLGRYIHDNPKFPACIARKLYSYASGESSVDVDPSSFKTSYKAFADSGYRFRALVRELATSLELFDVKPVEADTSAAGAH